MNSWVARIFITIFFLSCVLMTTKIVSIPKVNFYSGPAIFLVLYMPLLIVHLFLFVVSWVIEKQARAPYRRLFISSLLIMLFFVVVLIYYSGINHK